ncbi:MAG TPA: GNAT family N-acetyltransferase [Anaerolineae bacterium]|nr:GNAT family N-acetyltransferase [Anaerolineae bacterium]
MATDARWSIRPYEAGDEEAIRMLHEICHHKSWSLAQWRWQIRTLPTWWENEWVAVAEGQIIGHYAVTPVRFKLNEQEVIVAHGSDAMTHPSYRRQGVLSALGGRVNAVWGKHVPFQFGFPHEGWGSTRVRLGWQPLIRLTWMKFLLQPASFVARKSGLAHSRAARWFDRQFAPVRERKHANDIEVNRVICAGAEFDALWEWLQNEYRVLAVRDSAWVQWRYLDMPEAEQGVLLAREGETPRGYLAYHIRRDEDKSWAVIRDCFTAPRDEPVVRALLHTLKRELLERGVESIAALAVADSALYHAYRRGGFWARRVGYDFSIIPYHDESRYTDPQAWFVTGAEGDVV